MRKNIPRVQNKDSFLSWLNEAGAVFSNLNINKYKNGERGIQNKTAIQKHQVVIKIPRNLLIYSKMGENTPWGKKVSTHSAGIIGLNLVYLCLFIIQDMKNENRFGPYYDILPKKYNNFPIFWSKKDKKYLENSHLLKELNERMTILTGVYDRLVDILGKPFSSNCSLQRFLEIRTLVGSRNFGLWIDGEKQTTLVPLGDMLNHSKTPSVNWGFDKHKNSFVIKSNKALSPHQQITDSYGTKCNRSYMLYYGFALSNNDYYNTLFLHLDQSTSTHRLQSLRDQLISTSFSRNISNDFNQLNFRQMMQFLRVSNANETELQDFIKNRQLTQNIYNKRNEAAALSDLGLKIKQLLDSYPLSYKQNKSNLRKLPEYSNASFATLVVMGEKKIMHELLAFIKIALGILLLSKRVSSRQLKNNANGYMITLQTLS